MICLIFLIASQNLEKKSSAPLCQENFDLWSKKFDEYTQYLLSLKHVNGQLLVKGPRKSAFMGFVVTMKSIMYIYQCYVKTNHLQYLLTFKFSQDHLGITVSFEIFD